MDYRRCWEPGQVRAVLTTESRQKARDLFLRTHLPFRRIRVDFCKEADLAGRFIGEEELRALVEAGRLADDNRLFLVVGEAGSGKSELCQWLEYQADPSSRLAIHVPRSMTSAAHVAALLRRALGLAGGASLQHTPIDVQASHAALSAIVLLYEQQPGELAPRAAWEQLLAGEAAHSVIARHLRAAAAGDWGKRLLPEPGELALAAAAAGVGEDALATGWPALRQLVAQALEQSLWLGDVRSVLGEVAERSVARGLRPLLLIEDITAFRTLGDRLLDYLLDLSSGHFDAVVGVTTGYERTQLAAATVEGDLTHIHHRLRARLVLTDEHGRSYGLEDDVVELARGYLRALKQGCADCPAHAGCDEVFGPGLYPFTETALRRALSCLHEEGSPRQTPRLFLEHVLGAALLADTPPPATLDRSPYLAAPPSLFRADDVPDDGLRRLLRWYGHAANDAVTLDRRVVDFWSTPVPEALLSGEEVRAPRTFVAPARGAPEPGEEWSRELRELQRWLDQGGPYPSRETLKRGAERVLLALGDPRALGSPRCTALARAEIVYARGDERLPIALGRGSGDQPVTRASPKVRIEGLPEERAVLEELAYVALSGADLSQVCQNLALTLEWARERWECYNLEVRDLLRHQLGGVTAEALILIAFRLVGGLHGSSSGGAPDISSLDGAGVSYAERTPWSRHTHWGPFQAGEQLAQWHETVRRLFIGAFCIRDSLLDLGRYHKACEALAADDVLERLAELPLASLRGSPFKIWPTGQRLYDLLSALQRYAEALRRLDVSAALADDVADLEGCAAHLHAQQGLNVPRLREAMGELRWRCAHVGVVWREHWDAALAPLEALSHEDLGSLAEQVSALVAKAKGLLESGPSLWDYQDLQHLARPVLAHPYWNASDTLASIQVELMRCARARFRGDGRSLAGTHPYRDLLRTVRLIREELRNG